MYTPDNGEVKKIHQTGGLPSGLYLTSIVGDGYNLTVATATAQILELLGIRPVRKENTDIQGDDTSFLDMNPALLQLTDWVIKRQGFVGGDGKFGITSGSTEFLRVSFDETGAYGYPARSMGGLVQRKPWSDSPMSELSVIEGIIEAVRTCSRRGQVMDNVEDKLLRIWCRKNNVSYIAARIPRIRGGYGLSEPISDASASGLPKLMDIEGVSVDRKTEFRNIAWNERAETLGIVASSELIRSLSDEDSISTVVGDEVRGVSNMVRKDWKERLTLASVKIHRLIPLGILHIADTNADIHDLVHGTQIAARNNFAVYKHLLDVLADMRRLLPVKREQISWLKHNRQDFFNDYTTLGNRIGYRDAEHWLTGKLPSDPRSFNPIMSQGFSRMIANNVRLSDVPKGRLVDIWLVSRQYVLERLEADARVRKIFSW
jgi:hypothetical protein